mgnify:FL=1
MTGVPGAGEEMVIIPVIHDRDFTIIDNAAIRDRRISFKARGLLHVMLSLPPNWRVSADRLARQYSDCDGRSAVLAGMKELELHHYIRRVRRRGADGQVRTDTYVYESPSLNPEFENQPAVDGPIDPPEIENRTSDTVDAKGPENDSRIPVSELLRPGAENPPPAGDLVTPEPQQTRDTTASTPPPPSAESPAPDAPAPGSPVPVHQPSDTPPPEDRTAIEEIPTKNFPLPPAAENDDPAAEPTQGSKLPRTPSRSTSRGLRAQGRSPRQIADAEARELARTQGLVDWAHALASTEGVTLEVVDARLESEVKQNRCTPAEADKVRAITVELGVASEPEAVVLSPADALKAARHELRKSREAAEAQRAADEAPDPQPSLFDGEPVETGDYL